MMWSNPIRILKANEREQKDKSIQVVIKHRKKEKKKILLPFQCHGFLINVPFGLAMSFQLWGAPQYPNRRASR